MVLSGCLLLRTLSTDESQREIHEDSRTPDICRTIKPIKPPKMLVKAELAKSLFFSEKLPLVALQFCHPCRCTNGMSRLAALTKIAWYQPKIPKKNPSSVYFSKSFCGLVLHHNQSINSPIVSPCFRRRAMVLFPSPPGSERVSWIFFLKILLQETETVPCLEKALKKMWRKGDLHVIFANDFTLDHVPTCKFISVT